MSSTLKIHSPADPATAITDGAGNILLAFGSSAPANGSVGYAAGALFLDTTAGTLYRNAGTATSANFDPASAGTQSAAMTATHAAFTQAGTDSGDVAIQALVQNTGFGFVLAAEGEAVIACVRNLMTRMNEVEAALEAAGIVAAN